jgi:RloB-like protein
VGRDHQPKARQLARQEKKENLHESYPRILIVSEGSKTEPLYFRNLCAEFRLPATKIIVKPCESGTAPIQVVKYAIELFKNGDAKKGIRPKSFDQIYAVFDRDDHESYHDALQIAASNNGKLSNDEKQRIPFKAIASVPSFELWLLLHYQEVQAPLHRNEVMSRLKKYIPNYTKGYDDAFEITWQHSCIAKERAERLAARFTAKDEPKPFTAIFELVKVLSAIRRPHL